MEKEDAIDYLQRNKGHQPVRRVADTRFDLLARSTLLPVAPQIIPPNERSGIDGSISFCPSQIPKSAYRPPFRHPSEPFEWPAFLLKNRRGKRADDQRIQVVQFILKFAAAERIAIGAKRFVQFHPVGRRKIPQRGR